MGGLPALWLPTLNRLGGSNKKFNITLLFTLKSTGTSCMAGPFKASAKQLTYKERTTVNGAKANRAYSDYI